MRNCALIHPLHLELETAQCMLVSAVFIRSYLLLSAQLSQFPISFRSAIGRRRQKSI